jgi:hypothetical protein
MGPERSKIKVAAQKKKSEAIGSSTVQTDSLAGNYCGGRMQLCDR